MRLSAIVFLLTVIMVHGFAGSLTAQQVTLSKVNADFEAVIEEIRQQTGYDFMVKKEIVQQAKPLTITVREASLESVLKQVVANQNLTFKILDDIKMVVISEKPSNPPVISSEAEGRREISSVEAQQPTEIRGRLIDSLSRPVEGATIQVVADDGRGVRTTSDRNGGFTIKAPMGATLRISSIGYETREVVVERSTVNVMMKIAVNDLDEIQVMAYGVTSKRFQTGNVTQINAKDIVNKYTLNNLMAIQGMAPGLNIAPHSGMVGGTTRIRVQGEGSISYSAPPLYVVDGMPMSSYTGANMLQPGTLPFGAESGQFYRGNITDFVDINNIESITVMRDAEAVSIYGSRGANGVIIITTKGRGQLGNHLDATLNYTIGTQPRRLDMMNTEEYLYMRKKAVENDGITINPISFAYFDLTRFDQNAYTDWQEELFSNKTHSRNVNVGFRTASSRAYSNLSVNYADQNQFFGTGSHQSFKGNKTSQFSMFNNLLELVNTFNFYRETSDQVPADMTNQALLLAPNFPREAFFAGTFDVRDPQGDLVFPSYTSNAMAVLNSQQNEFGQNQFHNRLKSTLRLLPGLRYEALLGWSHTTTDDRRYVDNSEAASVYNNPSIQSQSILNRLSKSNRTLETFLSYERHFDDIGASLNGVLGYSFNSLSLRQEQSTYLGFSLPEFIDNFAFANSVTLRQYTGAEYVYKGYFVRGSLNFRERYLLNLNYRYDGSSRFAPENRWAGFYSLSGAWILSDEQILKTILPKEFFIKLRGSYGISGNDNIPNYSYMNRFTYSISQVVNSGLLTPNNVYNPDYRWEKMEKTNLGMDVRVNRFIDASINYNFNRASNQLLQVNMPTHLGAGGGVSQHINLDAVFHNTSWEFQMDSEPLKSNWLDLKIRGNITLPRSVLKKFSELANSPLYRSYEVGKPPHGTQGYRYSGLDVHTGLYTYLDLEGNPTTNQTLAHQVRFSTQPAWFAGLMLDLDFKWATLNAQLYGSTGQSNSNAASYYSTLTGFLPGYGAPDYSSNVERRFLNNVDAKPDARYQRFTTQQNVLTDLDRVRYHFLRLNNLALSLPLHTLGIDKANGSLTINASNVLLYTNTYALNYESASNLNLPQLTQYTLSLRVAL